MNKSKLSIPIILFILFVLLMSVSLTAPVHRWGDTSTYYMQIQSIANDFDIQYEQKDIQYALENKFDDLPAGLFLIKTNNDKYYYGKEFSYALSASLFYKLLGNNGIFVFNGLMFFIMILLGYLYLKTENENKVALIASTSFFMLSTAFAYMFWIHVEIYNMFLIMISLFFWRLYYKNDEIKFLTISSFLFGVAFVAKTPNIILFIPLLFFEIYHYIQTTYSSEVRHPNSYTIKRFYNIILMISVFLFPVFLIYGYFYLNTEVISFYGGNRLYYINDFPFTNGYNSINEIGKAGFSVTENRISALINTENLKIVPYNLFYYIFGRFAGMIWYYPFALFALISIFTKFLQYANTNKNQTGMIKKYISSNMDEVLIFTGIVLYILFFCTIIGNNYLGGQHALGNRYFYVYPAFIFLIKKIDLKKFALIFIISIIFLSPVILNPIENSASPDKHMSYFPYSYLPVEYTQLNNLPFWTHSHKIEDLNIFRLDDNSKYDSDSYFIVKGSTDIILKSKNKINILSIALKSKNGDTFTDISIGNYDNTLYVNDTDVKILTIIEPEPIYFDNRYNVYKLTIFSSDHLLFKLSTPQNLNSKMFLDNWYSVEMWNDISTRWMSNNGILWIYSNENEVKNLSLRTVSYHKPKTMEIYVNDILQQHAIIPTTFVTITTPISLDKGDNFIRFYTPDGCQSPTDYKLSNDTRCLSFAFQNIMLT